MDDQRIQRFAKDGYFVEPPVEIPEARQLHDALSAFAQVLKDISFNIYEQPDKPIYIGFNATNDASFFLTIMTSNGFSRLHSSLRLVSLMDSLGNGLDDMRFSFGDNPRNVPVQGPYVSHAVVQEILEAIRPAIAAVPQLLVHAGLREERVLDESLQDLIRFGFPFYDPDARVNGEQSLAHRHGWHRNVDGILKIDENPNVVLTGEREYGTSDSGANMETVTQNQGQNIVMDGHRQITHCPLVGGQARSSFIYRVPAELRTEFLDDKGLLASFERFHAMHR